MLRKNLNYTHFCGNLCTQARCRILHNMFEQSLVSVLEHTVQSIDILGLCINLFVPTEINRFK